ncbi:hypothetical protein B9Z55_022904 [Caenorhabditis nigoni]|uniref:Uncharacterized protein n=1 Tax=Caenorhabditis nigoni TaxID=1611254 RepID=A0A2G5SM70_9PELO|nr:hypothetical protein B9Z55_022904 [Caenorhabditis nigoni]
MMDQGKAEGIIQEYKDFKKMIQKNRIQPVRDLPLFDGELWRKAILASSICLTPEPLHKTASARLHGELSYMKLARNALDYCENSFLGPHSAVIPQTTNDMLELVASEGTF